MQLRSAEIDRYGPLYDCRPPCEEGITVLSGPNEAGKTLYLEALLQLLEPGIRDVLHPPARVEETPTGRVVVEHGGEQYTLTGDQPISEFSAIQPRHLQSVFVVRDNDLALPSDQSYYTSLIETLGDVHTSEIHEVKEALKDRGRLTDSRLNVSSDQSYNNAGKVQDAARDLAGEIRDYTETIEAEGYDDLEARRLQRKRSLAETREKVEAQRRAETVAEYERLSEQLDRYRELSETLDTLDGYTRDIADELRELQTNLERDREELAELATEREELAEEREALEATRDEIEEEGAEIERREAAVSEARSALEEYRDRTTDATGMQQQRRFGKLATPAAFLAAAIVGSAGAGTGSLPAIALGGLLVLVGIVSGGIFYRAHSKLSGVDTAREAALQAARDAGISAEEIEDIAPAIESFEDTKERVRERYTRIEQDIENTRDRLEEIEANRDALASAIDEKETAIEDRLGAVGEESIEAYEDAVDRRESVRADRQTARQSLVDSFGEAAAEEPMDQAAAWSQQLEALVAEIDLETVDAETYNETRLRELETEEGRLQEELDELNEQLEAYHDRLDDFDRRARSLRTEPFIGDSLALEARTKAGLADLAADLETVVAQIEDDAERSRKALQIFEAIEAEEEQQLTELFDPEGPASQTFERLTGGRYTEVAYDPDAHQLTVSRRDGRTFEPAALSQGTTDQLYFATRVSLARQLLGNEPGFLLLDDPFLAADSDRLREGFGTLDRLANHGWQILYLTAKPEVSEGMVEEFDLRHSRMESPSLGT